MLLWDFLSWRMPSHALVTSAICVQRMRSIQGAVKLGRTCRVPREGKRSASPLCRAPHGEACWSLRLAPAIWRVHQYIQQLHLSSQWGAMLPSDVNASSEQTQSPLASKGSRTVISCSLLLSTCASFFSPHRCSWHWRECTNSDLSGHLVYWESNRLPRRASPTPVRVISFPL